jgi:hypothetical protein
MAWQTYGLDREAQKLVLAAQQRDNDSLNQSFKMRMTAAYGLERFWGEQLRLQRNEGTKAAYWKQTWDALVEILKPTGVMLPNDTTDPGAMAQKLWSLSLEDQRLALAVLTQLCDCLIWWTQRYKGMI